MFFCHILSIRHLKLLDDLDPLLVTFEYNFSVVHVDHVVALNTIRPKLVAYGQCLCLNYTRTKAYRLWTMLSRPSVSGHFSWGTFPQTSKLSWKFSYLTGCLKIWPTCCINIWLLAVSSVCYSTRWYGEQTTINKETVKYQIKIKIIEWMLVTDL